MTKPRQRSRRAIDLQKAIIAAPEHVGADGHGRDGLVGYLRHLAARYPKQYAPLLGRVLLLPRVPQENNVRHQLSLLTDQELIEFERLTAKVQFTVYDEDVEEDS